MLSFISALRLSEQRYGYAPELDSGSPRFYEKWMSAATHAAGSQASVVVTSWVRDFMIPGSEDMLYARLGSCFLIVLLRGLQLTCREIASERLTTRFADVSAWQPAFLG